VYHEAKGFKLKMERREMKNLKNMFAAATLMTVMVFGTTFANAGIIMSRGAAGDTKTSVCEEPQSDYIGIIMSLTGIIVTAKTGIIMSREKDATVLSCGIIMS
jgi:formate-dependent nitrite reductase membrane component NrfD